jgi:ABC-type antimicrobial peptide transport system, permease component
MKKFTRNIVIFVKLLAESFAFAFGSIRANKTRAFLSLLGVTIGIFSIVAVLTMVDSLERNISESIDAMGSDAIYISRMSWMPEPGMTQQEFMAEYFRRPNNRYEDFIALQQGSHTAQTVAMGVSFSKEVKYGRKSLSYTTIIGITPGWPEISPFQIAEGRFFSPLESQGGHNVALIGHSAAADLFEEEDPIGKIIKVGGYSTRIIGVLAEEGAMISMTNYDGSVLIPLQFSRSMVDLRYRSPDIGLVKKSSVDKEEFLGEVRSILRSERRLKPSQKDNFAINEITFIKDAFAEVFSIFNMIGWVIGGFSLLIGGFGVANIMFVSVKERTPIIGLQKALGAKGYFVLTQFLFEAVLLAIMGGLIGILIVYAGAEFVAANYDFPIKLTLGNIAQGVSISSIIGIVAGFIPAYMASKLDPVVAINS